MSDSQPSDSEEERLFSPQQSDYKMVFVEFTKDFGDRFVGLDGRVYGPFDVGDVVRLPKCQKEILADGDVVV